MQIKNNNEVKLYLDHICSKVKNKRIHKEIREELLCHIEEMALDFLECGISEEESIKKSLSQMGSPNVVGEELNTIHKEKIDLKLLIIVSLLISFGFLTLYSIELNFLIKTLMFTLLGVITLVGTMFLDYRKLKNYSMHIYVITLILLVFSALLYPPIGGKTGWLFLGPVTISMPLISVFLFIISLSGLFNNIKSPIKRNLLSYMMLAIIPGIMLLITKSFLLFIIYSLALCIIMKVNNINVKYIISNSIINVFLFFTMGGYVKIIEQYTEISGNPQIHDIIGSMLKSSVLFGKAKNFNPLIMPDVHTDFVFTYIIYNFGWIIGAVVIILFLALVVRMIKMALNVKDSYGKTLIIGITSIFALEAFFSILMNLNLIPTAYISLPFISYSGSSSLISLLVIGIVINVYKGKTLPETSIV
ncbi:FtsW/RodA/SpoVE family cell cycle protein [Clostridium sp.]|uniref:FtsW/RodA/SpoVE family cell cycle protein n=1 Tax=Clostridium sp. TaxID=1506 RepID=UPI0034642773